MQSYRSAAWPNLRCAAGAVLAAAAALSTAAPASAETRVRARYAMTLAGFDIGAVTMQSGVDRASYDMNLSLRMSGLAKFFTGGKGAATSRGAIQDAKVSPSAYALNTRANDKGQIVRFALAGGAVRQLSVEPPPKSNRNVVPVSDADKRGVLDPLSAMVMQAPGSGDPLTSASCDRTLAVFDGRARYDVTLRYDRDEVAKPDRSANADPKAKPGYEGKVIVCKATYKPISGHRPDKEQTKFMQANKDMEVWLAPIAGTRTLLPWKISVRTQLGLVDITATSFVVDQGGAKGVDL